MILYVYSITSDLSQYIDEFTTQYIDEFNFTDCYDEITSPWFFPNVFKKFHMYHRGTENLKMFRKTDFKCFIDYLKNAHIIFINDNDVFYEQTLMIAETIYNTVDNYFFLLFKTKTEFEIPIR